MTTNNKFMLSMATIAILSGASVALGDELKVDTADNKLKLGATEVKIEGSVANVKPDTGNESNAIEVKSELKKVDGMSSLTINAPKAEVKIGDGTTDAKASIGGTAPTDGAVSADGYGFTIDASKVTLTGKDTTKTAELNVNKDSSITTSDTAGTSVGANSAINIANGKNLTVNGGLTTSETSSKVSVNGGSLKLNGDLTATNGNISLGKDGALNVTGKLTGGTAGKIELGGGTMSVGGVLDFKNKSTIIDLGGGTLNVNGGGELDGTKLTLTNGGTLNFGAGASADKPTATTISGAVSTTAGKATNVNLSQNTKVTFSGDSLTLTNNTDTALDKINLNGGTLEVKKLTADATNLNTLGGGVINFTGDANTAQAKDTGSTITNDFTISNGTALNLGKNAYLTLGGADKSVTTKGSKITFADSTSTLNVSNLNANASDFDMSKGGKIIFASGSKSQISGNVALGENQSYAFSAAGTLNLENLSLTKTGKIEFAGKDSVLNLANGMTSDDAKTQIVLKDGGTINFNGGNSVIKGKDSNSVFTTTANKDTLFNVKGGALNLENVKLADAKSILTIDGGVVNAAGLTTTAAENLALKQGTLNFVGKANDKGEIETLTSTIGADLDLSKAGAQVNFNKGSLVKFTSTDGKLTASSINLNGGEINLKKLTAAKGEKFSGLANLNFAGVNASVNGELSGTAAFSIGTDKDGNHFITKTGETAEVGANSALSLNSGVVSANGTLQTTGGKLVFNGGNLIVGEAGKLTIDDTKNLEVLKGGVLYLQGASDGDTTKSGSATIAQGDLDLSKGLNIIIDNGASLTTTAASTISGKGQSITLGKYAALSIDGSVKTAQNGKFEAYKVGALELGKGTTLGVSTQAVDGVYKELEVGKLSTKTGESANLRFGAGSVELTGEIQAGTNKLDNLGFVSGITLADDAVLNFNSGVVSVKGALNAATQDKATLKVSGATADLQGGLGDKMTKIELSGGGALNLKGDFAPTNDTTITTDGNSLVNINGGVSSADKLTFALLDIKNSGNYTVLTSTKGVTGDAKAELRTRTSLNEILGKYGLNVEDTIVSADNKKKVQDIVIADSSKDTDKDKISVKADGNNIVVTAKSFDSAIDSSSLQGLKVANDTKGMAADLKALETLKGTNGFVESNKETEFTTNTIDKLTQEQKNREAAAKITSNTVAAQELGGGGVNSDILLSAYGSTAGFGARDKDTAAAIGLDMVQNGGQGIVADIKEGASSAANMSSSTSSVINTMNLSNDMAISGRIAQANNPYGNLAQGFAGYEYAAVSGDLPLYYANNGYKNGFWANAIGGLNKVEGEGGTLVGLSLGFDKQLENTLVGFYLSYAMAGLNDKIVEQGADNIQVGVYTSFNQRDIEVNVKAYGQVAVTETTAKRGEGEAEAKFTRLYGGVSANVGFIFALNNNKTFIKPYVGENYYYAHTPAYEESLQSDAALSVKSANNHALSFDVGVDLRQYFNENSFMYLTPSLERYVVNAGGDYTAGFIGSDTTFTIEGKSKTKTYGQVLVGGNIALSDKLNVNLGLGVKKILNGQIERANGDKVDEMYLSGNLGVKYRF